MHFFLVELQEYSLAGQRHRPWPLLLQGVPLQRRLQPRSQQQQHRSHTPDPNRCRSSVVTQLHFRLIVQMQSEVSCKQLFYDRHSHCTSPACDQCPDAHWHERFPALQEVMQYKAEETAAYRYGAFTQHVHKGGIESGKAMVVLADIKCSGSQLFLRGFPALLQLRWPLWIWTCNSEASCELSLCVLFNGELKSIQLLVKGLPLYRISSQSGFLPFASW